jgi:hypothetical protein
MQDGCVRCKIPKYCGNQCKERHWAKKHHRECKHNATWCPACGGDIASDQGANITCERCQGVRYCSQQCLNKDFNQHIPRCPMTLPSLMVTETQATPTSGEGRAQMQTLLQPGGVRNQQSMLIDTEEIIAKVKNERWRLSRKHQEKKESDEQNAVKCEEARDRVLEWCTQHNQRSNMETWTAETASAKAVTELLQTTMGDNDFVCTREMWQAAIRVRDDLLVPLAQKLGAERGHRIWTTCIEGLQEITLCFQGIQATSRHQALALLKEAEVYATDGEWERAICTIRRRRGARPPLAAVTVKVQPNASLYRLLIDQQRVKQDKVDVWVCRDEEQLGSVTTLVPDPVGGGHCLRSWTNVYDMLGIPEALQRELILLAVMLEQPSFVPPGHVGGQIGKSMRAS